MYRPFENRMASADFQPKLVSMNHTPQSHSPATISTGGAAKWVRVPPMDTFTNSNPRVAYAKRRLGCRS
jgi:hypothetical protein